jgi:hypothetical protein
MDQPVDLRPRKRNATFVQPRDEVGAVVHLMARHQLGKAPLVVNIAFHPAPPFCVGESAAAMVASSALRKVLVR